MDQSDEALMLACQDGNESALETLIRRHGAALLGYLTRMTKSREQAEDLFQATVVRVHAKAQSFKGRGSFKGWLFSIASHLALDFLRKSGRHPTVPLETDEESGSILATLQSPDPPPSELVAQSDQAAVVRRALDVLPPRQRATLVLAYFEGQSYSEVATTLGCSVGTVKTQMSRALRTLARVLPDPAAPVLEGGGA